MNGKSLALTVLGLSMFTYMPVYPDERDEWFKNAEKEYAEFVSDVNEAYETFRQKANREYAEFMERPWKPVKIHEPLKRPQEPEPGPIKVPAKDVPEAKDEPMDTVSVPVVISETMPEVEPVTRPKPVEPILPTPEADDTPSLKIEVYGTATELPGVELSDFHLSGNDPKAFADGWRKLSDPKTDNLVAGCLEVRDHLNLPDWHYFLYVDKVAAAVTGESIAEQTLLMGYILIQSGYDIRFVKDAKSGQLHLFFNTDATFYNRMRVDVNGSWYYAYTNPRGLVNLCDFSMKGEKKLSTAITSLPRLDYKAAERKEIKVEKHPELILSVTLNRNLIDFYKAYPDASLGASELSRWSAHALVPTCEEIRTDVYPGLRKSLEGLRQYDAVNLLLRVAQSFPYEYDDKLWGGERVFFMEESWFYQASDCEDHAINFVHLVKDLLGLDTAFISYPGHLSAAVSITDGSEQGDYFLHKGKKYMVCDATYFYAPAGSTAPAYNNTSAKLVPLTY